MFVGATTKPFVSFLHIRSSVSADRSKESLFGWVQPILSTTQVYMTTTPFYGGPRVSRMAVGDLRQTEEPGLVLQIRQEPLLQELNWPEKAGEYLSHF